MEIQKTQTETYVLKDLEKLDAVTVYVTNYKRGAGKIVIECFGKSWANTWMAMGDRTIQEFFASSSNDYILNKLIGNLDRTDFDEIERIADSKGFEIVATSDFELAMQASDLEKCFGVEWYMGLPKCRTEECNYLERIVDSIKMAFEREMTDLACEEKK